jgi:hypothetical protein
MPENVQDDPPPNMIVSCDIGVMGRDTMFDKNLFRPDQIGRKTAVDIANPRRQFGYWMQWYAQGIWTGDVSVHGVIETVNDDDTVTVSPMGCICSVDFRDSRVEACFCGNCIILWRRSRDHPYGIILNFVQLMPTKKERRDGTVAFCSTGPYYANPDYQYPHLSIEKDRRVLVIRDNNDEVDILVIPLQFELQFFLKKIPGGASIFKFAVCHPDPNRDPDLDHDSDSDYDSVP